MPASPRRILFVCLGNICRSPAAEGVFRKMAAAAGLKAAAEACDSCGTAGWHAGTLPDSRMRATAARRGYSLVHRARQLKKADFVNFDLILTMDDDNWENARAVCPDQALLEKVKPFASYCRKSQPADIPDPYYGGPEGFEHVLDLLEEGCGELIAGLSK
ncbi:MAG: low molecular weight phosphotyrosine protein phosphatase [Puniceicoccales bacterium]|jgi:protein-tyrosine phosphatase|nr:low molecular weight phosphotyrosine protein phosphatase [Puniceicoccales bacterium]